MSDRFSLKTYLLTASALGALAFAVPLHAQEGEAEQEETQDEGAAPATAVQEEIVVTARRRDESLQDVPLSVSALTGEQLETAGAQDITFLNQVIPNTTLEVSRGTNTTLTAFIRGVGQQDPVAGFEQGVGIYLDDVYLARPQAAVLDIFNVERVEVLRGPQGTLYGRNTIGGAVKYVTERLSDEFEASLKFRAGSFRQTDGIVTFNLPIVDKLRVGGSFATLNRNGFGENIITGQENYNKSVLAGRLTAEWLPTPDLFFRIQGDILDDDSEARQGHRLIPGQLSGAPVLADKFDTRAGIEGLEQKVQAGGVSFEAEWDVTDRITIKNILAYREDKSETPIDFDSLQAEDVDVPAIYENDQLTEELQVLYSGDVTDGIVGFFYIDASAFNEFDVLLNTTAPLLGLPGLNATTLGDVQTQSWAIFGDFTFDLVQAFDRLGIDITRPWLSGLELTFGGRYTSDERTSRVLRRTFFDPNLSPDLGGPPLSERGAPQVTSDFEGSETFTDFTPKASISYQPTPDYTLYFTYSEGFKGGSFDPRGSTSAAPDFNQDGTVSEQEIFEFMKFEPETVESFEFGLKSTLFNGRITSNIAYFISDYTDVQVPGSVGVDTDGDGVNDSFAGVTTNAGEASIDGFEFEGNARIAEDVLTGGDFFTARGTMGYINAEYDRFVDASGENVADERVFQNTPEWTGNISATYGLPLDLGLARGELAFTASGSYRGETFQFEEPNPFLTQEAYWLLDLSVNWTDESGRVNVSLHGRNLTDERYIVSGYNFVALGEDGSITPTLGVEGTLTAFYGDPRTFTGVIEVRF